MANLGDCKLSDPIPRNALADLEIAGTNTASIGSGGTVAVGTGITYLPNVYVDFPVGTFTNANAARADSLTQVGGNGQTETQVSFAVFASLSCWVDTAGIPIYGPYVQVYNTTTSTSVTYGAGSKYYFNTAASHCSFAAADVLTFYANPSYAYRFRLYLYNQSSTVKAYCDQYDFGSLGVFQL